MFGPNKTLDFAGRIQSHHREPLFMNVIAEIKDVFKEKFNISNDYEIIVVTGSGTLAIESFIFSTTRKLNLGGISGEFKSRWTKLLAHHGKTGDISDEQFIVQLETSKSHVNNAESPYFVDAVSSFPYYDIPKGTKAWATVSSKILGGAPVLGVLVFHKDILNDLLSEDVFTYLNLKRMYKSSLINQTHHTPAMALYIDFLEKLKSFDLEKTKCQINRNSDLIVDALGEESIIGEKRCPVITVKEGVIPREICLKYNLYGSQVENHSIQIFTYAESDVEYEKLALDLINCKITI